MALRRQSERWLEWLSAELTRRGATPGAQLLILWDVLEEWFASEDFRGSFLANAAEPRAGLDRSAEEVVAAHRQAVRQLLEDLAKAARAHDPATLAAQVHVLVEGAVSCAAIDRQPAVARTARELTRIALASSTGMASRGRG